MKPIECATTPSDVVMCYSLGDWGAGRVAVVICDTADDTDIAVHLDAAGVRRLRKHLKRALLAAEA